MDRPGLNLPTPGKLMSQGHRQLTNTTIHKKSIEVCEDCLIDCLTARQYRRSICDICGGGKLAQVAKDGQQDTIHTTLCYTITM